MDNDSSIHKGVYLSIIKFCKEQITEESEIYWKTTLITSKPMEMTNNKQQTEHRFCLTPELKCTMSYCDENGCINRQRHLVGDPIEMKNNKQQTAVELLWTSIMQNPFSSFEDGVKAYQQAKEMEKEQIINAFWNGDNTDCTSEQNIEEFAEQYYEQTYGGGNK